MKAPAGQSSSTPNGSDGSKNARNQLRYRRRTLVGAPCHFFAKFFLLPDNSRVELSLVHIVFPVVPEDMQSDKVRADCFRNPGP